MPNPPGWCWIELRKAARLESGHTPSRKFASYWNGGIPWIGIKDARNHHGKRIFETLQTVTQEGLDHSAARLLPAGTVCLSRTASVGYALVMGKSMATSQDFVNWVCSEAVDPEFLMYLFIAERESLLRFGKGTTHTTIYYPEVKAFHVCLPPKREQRAIVEAIESYFTRLDDAVATLEQVQRNQKRYRASVLKAAVEGRLVPTEAELARAEGRDYEPASVLLERVLAERRRRWEEAELAKMKAKGKYPTDNKWKARYKQPVEPDTDGLPELPEGWCWVRAEQCVYSQVGHAFKSRDFIEDGVRLLRGDNIGHGELRWDQARRKCIHSDALSMHPHLHLATDDIVLAMDRPLISTGLKIANVRSTDLPALLVQRVIRLRPAVHREYFLLTLHSEPFVRHLSTEAKGGGVPHVSEGQIKDFSFPLPPLAEQERISLEVERLVSNAVDSIAVVDVSVRRCSRLRQSILRWAFEGKLVDQDPADEPATMLLKRITDEREVASSSTKTKKRGRKKTRATKP